MRRGITEPVSDLEAIRPIIKRVVKKFRLTPPKDEYIPTELDEQERVFLWAHGRPAERLRNGKWLPAIPAECTDPRIRLLFATMNGIRVSIGLAKKMKRSGNRRGVPDIVLPVIGYASCPGLFIELKRVKRGQVRDDQEWFHNELRKQGYQVEVCKGAKAAITVIEMYLKESHK